MFDGSVTLCKSGMDKKSHDFLTERSRKHAMEMSVENSGVNRKWQSGMNKNHMIS